MNQSHVLARLRQLAPWVLVLFSGMVVVAAYLQAINFPFISDENVYITTNAELSALPLLELWRLFIKPYNEFSEFLPLRDMSYWLDMTLFGLTPAAFRLHNIVLYLLCLPLVYSITLSIWQFFRPADAADAASVSSTRWAAATVTALFALNPSHVEAVVWIAGRKDVLSGMFSLLALWLALRVKREQGFSTLYATAALLALLAAMLSKATAVAVAPVIALLWLMFWRSIPVSDRRRILLLWPLASLLLAAYVALVFSTIITSRIPLYFGIEAVTRSLAVLGWLTRLAVSPETRHFIHPVFEDTFLPFMVSIGAGVLAVAAAGMMILYKSSQRAQHFRHSLEWFALITFLLLCIPSIQLIPYALPSLVADHFVFLAVWPIVLLVVTLSWRLSPVLRTSLLLVIALSWGFQTIERPRDLRNFEMLVDADWRAYPGNYILAIYKIYGIPTPPPQNFFHNAVETASSITIPEFRDNMLRLIEADHAVRVSASTGKPQEAMALLWRSGFDLKQMPVQAKWNSPVHHLWNKMRDILSLKWEYLAVRFPDDVSVRYLTGLWMLDIQNYESAAVHLRAATESQHLREALRGTAFYSLGLALVGDRRVADAEAPLYAALKQSPPDLRAHCLLSEVYRQTGRFEEASRARADCPSRTK